MTEAVEGDLARRLRDLLKAYEPNMLPHDCATLSGAAAEIERLRAAIECERADFEEGIKPDGTVWRNVLVGDVEYSIPYEVAMRMIETRAALSRAEAERDEAYVAGLEEAASIVEQHGREYISQPCAMAAETIREQARGISRASPMEKP